MTRDRNERRRSAFSSAAADLRVGDAVDSAVAAAAARAPASAAEAIAVAYSGTDASRRRSTKNGASSRMPRVWPSAASSAEATASARARATFPGDGGGARGARLFGRSASPGRSKAASATAFAASVARSNGIMGCVATCVGWNRACASRGSPTRS